MRYLAVRLVLVQVTQFGLGILLARTLAPAQFGALGLATALIGALTLLSDLGLGAAIVRKASGDHDPADLDAAFTVQILIGLAVSTAAFAGRHQLANLIWSEVAGNESLGPILGAALLAAPFRTGAMTRLERGLRFGRIAVIEVAEHLVYCTVMTVLLMNGAGVPALTGALVVRTCAGSLAGVMLSGWRPRPRADLRRARPLLEFGLSYQATAVLFVVNGAVVPLLIGKVAGATVLGQVLWAVGNAERVKPLLDSVMRVAFPSFARLQDDPSAIRRGLERTISGGLMLSCTYSALLAGTAPLAVAFLFTDTWSSTIPLLYVLLAAFPFTTATSFIDVLFFAMGYSAMARNIHTAKLLLYGGLAIVASARWGILGYGAAYCASVIFVVIADLWAVRRIVPLRVVLAPVGGPVIAAAAGALVARMGTIQLETRLHPFWALSLACIGASLAIALVLAAVDGARAKATVRAMIRRET